MVHSKYTFHFDQIKQERAFFPLLFCNTTDWTLGLVHAVQLLHHLTISPALRKDILTSCPLTCQLAMVFENVAPKVRVLRESSFPWFSSEINMKMFVVLKERSKTSVVLLPCQLYNHFSSSYLFDNSRLFPYCYFSTLYSIKLFR